MSEMFELVLNMKASAVAAKVARSLVGLVVIMAMLVATSNPTAAQPVPEVVGAVGVTCSLFSDHGTVMPDDRACDVARPNHASCLSHAGCLVFTLPSANALSDTSLRSISRLRLQIHSLLGRVIPLETPPPIFEA